MAEDSPTLTVTELALRALRLRRMTLEAIFRAGAGHTGGSLSCLDILVVLYRRVLKIDPGKPDDPERDRYLQSKGHSVESLYAVLADCGFFPVEELETLCRYRSRLVGHPTRALPGIEANTGALGHGLAIAAGMAKAAQLDNASWRVFTLLGDGELAEGSNWEAAMMAAHHRLDHLTAIVDYNKLQITGRVAEVNSPEPLADKWRAFGWTVREVDGHDYAALIEVLQTNPEAGHPTVVIAHTTKGKGISFMENEVNWHHRVPSREEMDRAFAELEASERMLSDGAATGT